jgi:hypothetical protein
MIRTTLRAGAFSLSTLLAIGCSGSKSATPVTPAAAPAPTLIHPLGALTAQDIIIAPFQGLRVPAEIGWPAVQAARPTLAKLDSIVTDTLRARVGNQKWVYADGLLKAAANNPTYATDPRALAVLPLRATGLKIDDRLPEPLASQIRTMIAFHDARLVLIPVDLTIERTGPGMGRGIVRLVLVDPRRSVVRWVGQIKTADSPAFTPDFSASIAALLADLFVPR